MIQDFLIPKLEGERFREHTIPIEVLSDLQALQELLTELAKNAYMRNHPDRKRVPKNFSDDVQIHLAAVEEGSALPKFVFFFAGLLPLYAGEYHQARTEVTQAVEAASTGQQPMLPPKFLNYFERVGRNLRAGESLGLPTANRYVKLDQDTRHRLIQASQMAEWTDRMTVRARISSNNLRNDKYELHLLDGSVLTETVSDEIRDQIRNAYMAYGTGKDEWLLFRGIVRKNREGRLIGFASIDDVSPAESLDVVLRLRNLAHLEDGWLDGSGRAPNTVELDWFGNAFDRFFASDLRLPHIYPTPQGGVQGEWDLARWNVSLEVDLESHRAEFLAFDLDTQDDIEVSLDLNTAEGWTELNTRLRDVQTRAQVVATA